MDVDVAEDGRDVEAVAVREGDEQRESSVSSGVEVSEVNDEWRVAAGMAGRGVIESDSLSAEGATEVSSAAKIVLDGTVEARLIAVRWR